MDRSAKIIITGAAGLVGQNLVLLLKELGYTNLVGLDKHGANCEIFKELNPEVKLLEADLAESGKWEDEFRDVQCLIQLHAQIGAKTEEPFIRNTVRTTELVLAAAKKYHIPYIINASSSVLLSVVRDFYTESKRAQEKLVAESGIPYCSLRPTLMFGWLDRKHVGWLARFMHKTPIFPVPGNGKYLRQPLYVRDFCRIIIKCLEQRPQNKTFDIIGKEKIYYIDMIRAVKEVQKLKTLIIKIPYSLFYFLLKLYALFDRDPPFTASQLKALCAGDEFEYFDWEKEFGLQATPFRTAVQEAFLDPRYSQYVLKF